MKSKLIDNVTFLKTNRAFSFARKKLWESTKAPCNGWVWTKVRDPVVFSIDELFQNIEKCIETKTNYLNEQK